MQDKSQSQSPSAIKLNAIFVLELHSLISQRYKVDDG